MVISSKNKGGRKKQIYTIGKWPTDRLTVPEKKTFPFTDGTGAHHSKAMYCSSHTTGTLATRAQHTDSIGDRDLDRCVTFIIHGCALVCVSLSAASGHHICFSIIARTIKL